MCDRLIAPTSLSNERGDEVSPTNEEIPIELEENSNCIIDDGFQALKGGKN